MVSQAGPGDGGAAFGDSHCRHTWTDLPARLHRLVRAGLCDQWARGAFPESDRLPAGFTLVQPNINLADPKIEIPRNHQLSAEIERQLGQNRSVSANYVLVLGRQLLVSDNANLLGSRASLLLLAEAFNLFNRVNNAGVNTTWGTDLVARSSFGQFTSANDPRQLQFGVKLQF